MPIWHKGAEEAIVPAHGSLACDKRRNSETPRRNTQKTETPSFPDLHRMHISPQLFFDKGRRQPAQESVRRPERRD